MNFHEFVPKSYLSLRQGYNFQTFRKDLIAGITVGIIALPLAMAFAIASGTTPDRGLFTAIVAGFLISALGGSRVQIGGPTGAFVVIIYGIIQRTGYEGLVASTLVAAAILMLFGIFRLGTWIKYVPYPLTTGFTAGLAVLIFSTQIKDFFGLQMGDPPADFLSKWAAYMHAFPTFDPLSLAIGSATLATILLIRRFAPKLPWGIAAIVLSTAICWAFHLPVATIQSKFGEIPHNLPIPHFPAFSIPEGKLGEILLNGCSIALLGAIESLLCCVIADGMIGGRHKSNGELISQGISNFASVAFGGLPATGAIARTAVNVKTGAVTPVAGMIHAATLFLIILFFAPLVSQIPLSALAAVLIMVAWNMSEVGHFLSLLKSPAGDVVILVSAFFLTVLVDITVAILLSMTLASLIFMKRMVAHSRTVKQGDSDQKIPEGVEIYEIHGPLSFGSADLFKDLTAGFPTPPKLLILRMRNVPMVDASGVQALKEFFKSCSKRNTTLFLSSVQQQAQRDLEAFGVEKDHIFPRIDEALAKAADIVK